ncbi:MAG: hypothetical protein Q9205_008085, partial [Flavoplaca limonia]
ISHNLVRQDLPEDNSSEVLHYLYNPYEPGHPDILAICERIKAKYPALARMARNMLTIPIAGVGVERLFNMARDIIYYRRNRFRPQTIENIMILKRTQWFTQGRTNELLPADKATLNAWKEDMMNDRETQAALTPLADGWIDLTQEDDELDDAEPIPSTQWIGSGCESDSSQSDWEVADPDHGVFGSRMPRPQQTTQTQDEDTLPTANVEVRIPRKTRLSGVQSQHNLALRP